MREEDTFVEESRNVEDLHELRLRALLYDLVRVRGRRGAARMLDIDRRTLGVCLDEGVMSRRVRVALEKALLTGQSSVEVERRERLSALEERVDELEKKTERGLEAVERGTESLRKENAEGLRRLERRLARAEAERDAQGGAKAATETVRNQAAKPAWRPYPDVVTQDPEPGEEQVYGDAAPLIVEWRRASAEFMDARDGLSRAVEEERLRELEVEMIEERRLTLPPSTYPWDGFDRRSQLWTRRQALGRARVERARARLRRWIRRVLTLGLWRN